MLSNTLSGLFTAPMEDGAFTIGTRKKDVRCLESIDERRTMLTDRRGRQARLRCPYLDMAAILNT